MQSVKEYWNSRAATTTPTTNDIWLRELEAKTITAALKEAFQEKPFRLVDIGCGDGLAIKRLAMAFPSAEFLGLDNAESMIEAAGSAKNVSFKLGDATGLAESLAGERYDAIMTGRCLINLPDAAAQYDAIYQIANHLKYGGYYFAIENFTDGQDNMNKAREVLDLEEIPVRWHNKYFDSREFLFECKRHFCQIRVLDFSSSYYFATRVVYSAMCKLEGREPDYNHEIHKRSIDLPASNGFSPIKLAIMRRNWPEGYV